MYKDCLTRCFYNLEEFDLFGYLSWNLKPPKILGKDAFISEIASWTLPSNTELPTEPFAYSKLLGDFLSAKNCKHVLKNVPFENVWYFFSVVANLLGDFLLKKSVAVWLRGTEIRRTVWLARTHFFPENYRWVPHLITWSGYINIL